MKFKANAEKKRILAIQMELFPSAQPEDLEAALELLRGYQEMKIVVEDYKSFEVDIKEAIYEGEIARRIEADALYADKTANAALLAQNQKQAAEQLELIKKSIDRAVGMIRDSEARQAIIYRYIQGYSYKETLSFMHWGVKSSTLDRRLKAGIASVANTLKMWGII